MLILVSETSSALIRTPESTSPLMTENQNPNPPEITGPLNGKSDLGNPHRHHTAFHEHPIPPSFRKRLLEPFPSAVLILRRMIGY